MVYLVVKYVNLAVWGIIVGSRNLNHAIFNHAAHIPWTVANPAQPD